MDDYIEWGGTEKCLDSLLVWWGECIPWEHSPGCTKDSLHCCEGIYEFESCFGLQMVPLAGWPDQFTLYFVDEGQNKVLMDIGDRIYYRGRGRFELVKHA